MRRVKYACLGPTLPSGLRDALPPEETNRLVRAEYDQYKADLERKRIPYKIVSETVQPDGSIIVKVKKQYNAHDCGDYLA